MTKPQPSPAAQPPNKKSEEIGVAAPVKRNGCRGIPGPGRPKGSPNKIRKEIAELVRDVLEMAGEEKWMLQRAQKNPTAFLALVAKLMPTKINADVNVNTDLAARLTLAEQRINKPKS